MATAAPAPGSANINGVQVQLQNIPAGEPGGPSATSTPVGNVNTNVGTPGPNTPTTWVGGDGKTYSIVNGQTVTVNPTFSGDNATSTSSTVTSSDPYGNAVSNLGNNISAAANNAPVVNTGFGQVGYDPSQDPQVQADTAAAKASQQAQETQLQTERDQAIAALQEQQTTDTTNLTNTQNNETGDTTRNFASLQQGGTSASAQAYLNQLQVTHTQEMSALNAKYTTAIQQAQNAYTDKDFALAQQYTADAKAIQTAALARNQAFIDTTLKINAANQSAATQAYTEQKDQQTFNKDNKIVSRFYQYPGNPAVFDSTTGKQVDSAAYAAAGGVGQAGGFKDIQVIDPNLSSPHSAAYTEWQDYVSQGGKLSFNDYQTMDQNRKIAVAKSSAPVTYNETQAAQLKADSAQTAKNLQSKVGKDGYVSPQIWQKALKDWTDQGYSGTDFVANYKQYANPGDPQDYGLGVK